MHPVAQRDQMPGGGRAVPRVRDDFAFTRFAFTLPFTASIHARCATSVADEGTAAKYLARQWLVDAMAGVNVSIYYDWADDCDDDGSDDCKTWNHAGDAKP